MARISGAAGLLISAGIDAGTPLSGDEVRTILRSTAFDIALTPEETEIANTYPSAPGWDAFYGYGRVDLGQAVEDVFAGDLPASIEITSPEWFSWHAGSVTLEARLGLRGGEADWVLELGRGAEPTDWTCLLYTSDAADE